jgi:nitronate monooxygenase
MWNQTRVTQLLDLQVPIVQGPFGGGLSSARLAAAVSNAGGLGSFGAHHLPPAQIEALVRELRGLTDRPFALNLWVEQPEAPLPREVFDAAVTRLTPYYHALGLPLPTYPERFGQAYAEQVEALLEARPPVFSFVFGIPAPHILEACRARGIKTLGAATNVDEAIALAAAGVDAIVCSGSEAGGHRVSFLRPAEESPALSALVPQVADRVKTPLIAAGGIADGRTIVAALALGAEAVQVGTAFLNCVESNASDAHRAAIRAETSRYTLLTRAFSGRLARGIRNRFLDEVHTSDVPGYPYQNWLTQPLRKTGHPDFLALWAGQNAPLVRHDRAADVVRFLVEDTERVLRRLAAL